MSEGNPEPSAAANPTAPPSRSRLAIQVAAALAVGLIAALAAWWMLAPTPALGPGLSLAESGRYAQAEPKLAAYLAYDPSNARAGLAMANVLMNLEPPKVAEAIERLDAIRAANPSQAAHALMIRGKAHRALDQPGKAESEWREALRRDPMVAEAGMLLLELYYTEGRNDEQHQLALRLHRSEPDPIDRVRLLLEAMRPDAEPLAAAGVIALFRPVVKEHPDDLYPALAYYRALAKDGTGIDEALTGLRRLTEAHPDDLACWDGLLYAMAPVDLDNLESTIAKLPPEIASSRKLARYRGQLAESKRDFAAAIAQYNLALTEAPADREILHRLGEVLKLAGRETESQAVKRRETEVEAARVELRGIKGREPQEGRLGVFEEATSLPNLGRTPAAPIYQKLASIRERMGHPDEALAWHKLALRDAPEDAESRAAVDRLEKALGDRP